jgi:dCTP deaminase
LEETGVTLLHTKALRRALDHEDWEQKLIITPLLETSQIGEASIDLRLGNEFLLLRRTLRAGVELGQPDKGATDDEADLEGEALERRIQQIQAEVDDLYEQIEVPFGDGIWLHPQQFALGSTFEFIRLPPTLGANVLSRSTWGRLGLLVATAVMVQPEFAGALTLELVNESDSPIRLYPGLKIAQLTVFALPNAADFWRDEDDTAHDERYGAEPTKAPTYRWPTGPQAARVGNEYRELAKIKKVGRALARV